MTIPALHLGLQVDIFALFNRPELSRISETNRRVNAIIEKSPFASSPRMVFDYVFYKSNGEWKWSDDVDLNGYMHVLANAASPMSDSQIAQLSTSKFLRFRRSDFIFDEEYPLDLLEVGQFKASLENNITIVVFRRFPYSLNEVHGKHHFSFRPLFHATEAQSRDYFPKSATASRLA
ncbi:hypothetical protein Ddc_16827 [Ditylenchus destructor]|nr:hypothetical protein Ddc_16827 [Ditylenchus destructor]